MIKAIVISISIVVVLFFVLAFYACCVVAGRADQLAEAAFIEHQKNKNNTKNCGKERMNG